MPLFSDREENPAACHYTRTPQSEPPQPKAGVASNPDAGGGASRPWLTRILFVFGAMVLALATLASPRVPGESDTAATADASWSAVLQYAHAHRLQFGTDIVFTYGPLGFLTTPYASSASLVRLAIDFLLSLLSAIGVCLIAARVGWARRIVLITVYLFLLGNIYPRTDLLIELSLLCWALLCAIADGRRLAMYVLVLAGVAAFCALVKITLLILASLTLAVMSVCLILRRYRLLSLMLPTLASVAFMAGWIGTGQNPLNLGTFLGNALITSQGYNDAMGYEGSLVLRARGLLTGLLALAALFATAKFFDLGLSHQSDREPVPAASATRGEASNAKESHSELISAQPLDLAVAETGIRGRLLRGLLFCWACVMLFLVWKHGFVRTDLYHAGFFFGFAPLLALSFGTLTPPTRRESGNISFGLATTMLLDRTRNLPGRLFWQGVFTGGCCLFSVFTVQTMILPGDWKNSLLEPFSTAAVSLSNLAHPARYRDALSQALQSERQRYQLPAVRQIVARSAVDMFGCEQTAVLANDLNYRPRPVFQTYAAYAALLMRWNERFYQSDSRPEFVLFHLMPLDRKFPALEDALLLRNLLINYEPVQSEGPFLLLKTTRNETPSLTLLREGTFHVGEQLSLAQFGDVSLWLELEVKPTFAGRLRQFLYQPAKSRLLVWSTTPAGEQARRFRAPPLMLAAGFLVSPLELDNEDVRRLYAGGEVKRPNAIGVEFNPGDEKLWRKTIRFRLYQLNNKLGGVTSRNS